MCLIVFALGVRSDMPLVLGANRDEAHARRTAPAQIWGEAPWVAGGRDLEQGGSWLLATRSGRLAAVTNHRRLPVSRGPSRGWLVRDFALGTESAREYVTRRAREGFPSFNLLAFDGSEMWQLEDDREPTRIAPGIHGLSNARLDDPWPKVERSKRALSRAIDATPSALEEALFAALGDRSPAKDEDLPDTGVGLAVERVLSAPFIVSSVYGTRSTTVVTMGDPIRLRERSFDASGSLMSERTLTV